jgi:hypothetical protein
LPLGSRPDSPDPAVVAKARYSEPAAEHIAATFIKRRDKVVRVVDRRQSGGGPDHFRGRV